MNDDPVNSGDDLINHAEMVLRFGNGQVDDAAVAESLDAGRLFQNLSEIAARPSEWIGEGSIPRRKRIFVTGGPGWKRFCCC